MFYSESVSGTTDRNLHFQPAGALGDHVAGKLSMKEPMNGINEEDGPWRLEAEFSSTVVRRPAVTAVLTGAGAMSSPQYKAAKAFLDACGKKDLDAIAAAIDPRTKDAMMAMFSGAKKQEALDMFAAMAADTLTFKLSKVTVRGETAAVEFKDPKPDAGGSQTLQLVLVAGAWKIAQ